MDMYDQLSGRKREQPIVQKRSRNAAMGNTSSCCYQSVISENAPESRDAIRVLVFEKIWNEDYQYMFDKFSESFWAFHCLNQ
jgi:hypothetical protein